MQELRVSGTGVPRSFRRGLAWVAIFLITIPQSLGFAASTPADFAELSLSGTIEQAPAFNQIHGRIFIDSDLNRIDENEPGIEGVTVELLHLDTIIGSAVSNENGYYYFGGIGNVNLDSSRTVLPSTEYSVRVARTDGNLPSVALSSRNLMRRGASESASYGTLNLQTSSVFGSNSPLNFGFAPEQEDQDVAQANFADLELSTGVQYSTATYGNPVRSYDVVNIPSSTGTPSERSLWIDCFDVDGDDGL
ncbi:MAG: hypothetical protein AAF497_25905, partial [Planctomycetota bacterium]